MPGAPNLICPTPHRRPRGEQCRKAQARSRSLVLPPQILVPGPHRTGRGNIFNVQLVTVIGIHRSWYYTHQIDDREYRNPDDVEGVPEQIETEQAMQDRRPEALDINLRHHRAEPQKPDAHMQAVTPTRPKKEDRKALCCGPAPLADERRKFLSFEEQKPAPSRPVTRRNICVQRWLRALAATAAIPAGKARSEKKCRLSRDTPRLE